MAARPTTNSAATSKIATEAITLPLADSLHPFKVPLVQISLTRRTACSCKKFCKLPHKGAEGDVLSIDKHPPLTAHDKSVDTAKNDVKDGNMEQHTNDTAPTSNKPTAAIAGELSAVCSMQTTQSWSPQSFADSADGNSKAPSEYEGAKITKRKSA